MKGKSHILLGHYLASRYLTDASRIRTRFFLIGCIQPDRNPVTYLKGSFRSQWLRGHNWGNSQRYIQRVANRLEGRRFLHIWDYYTLGKLVHYTMDAFTFPHNIEFTAPLKEHNAYEERLQSYFLSNVPTLPFIPVQASGSMIDTIRLQHHIYDHAPRSICTDTLYAVSVCSCLLSMLFPVNHRLSPALS